MSTNKFRLPRKLKKKLKKGMWLYPSDENGSSLVASPAVCQKDYIAYKEGILRNLYKRRSKKERQKFADRLNKEIIVSDATLKSYVEDIIRKELRRSTYDTLIKAKNTPRAIKAYYNFVNAYQIYENGEDSYGNICCMSIDRAKELLKNK